MNESLTIGNGNSGTLTYSGSSKTLTVEDNATVNQDLTTDADVTFGSATISDLTSGRVVLAGASGAIEDSGNLTFNGSKLIVTGNAQITSDLDVDGGANISGGETTLSSATISDLTSGRVVLAGASGAIEDSGNLTFNGSKLTVTGNAQITSDLEVSGSTT